MVNYDSDDKGVGFFDTNSDSNGSAAKAFMGQGQSDLVTIGNPNIWVSDIWNGIIQRNGEVKKQFFFLDQPATMPPVLRTVSTITMMKLSLVYPGFCGILGHLPPG